MNKQSINPSIDQSEIAKFDKLAATWWDPTGPMWPLHTLNQLRTGYIVEQLTKHFGLDPLAPEPLRGIRVLDIGCGGGLLSESMARHGATVHGVDMVERSIVIARQHAEPMYNSPSYECSTAEALLKRNEAFDVVLNMEVVEHVGDLAAFMHACNSIVGTGGLQLVSTINRNPVAWLVAIIGAEYVLRWLPKGTHQYRKLVKPAELQDLLTQDRFELVATTGVSVNPFNRKMSLNNSRLINYMLVAKNTKS